MCVYINHLWVVSRVIQTLVCSSHSRELVVFDGLYAAYKYSRYLPHSTHDRSKLSKTRWICSISRFSTRVTSQIRFPHPTPRPHGHARGYFCLQRIFAAAEPCNPAAGPVVEYQLIKLTSQPYLLSWRYEPYLSSWRYPTIHRRPTSTVQRQCQLQRRIKLIRARLILTRP